MCIERGRDERRKRNQRNQFGMDWDGLGRGGWVSLESIYIKSTKKKETGGGGGGVLLDWCV